MNDYCKGALEALAWAERLLREDSNPKLATDEIKTVVQDILDGVAVDFHARVRVALPPRR